MNKKEIQKRTRNNTRSKSPAVVTTANKKHKKSNTKENTALIDKDKSK